MLSSTRVYHLFMQIGRLLEGRTREALSVHGLHHGQGRILAALHRRGGMIQAELARGLGLRPATVTGMVQRLERDGFVIRRTDPATNRALVVELTSAGRAAAVSVGAVWDDLGEMVCGLLAGEDGGSLVGVLESVRDGLGGSDPRFSGVSIPGDAT